MLTNDEIRGICGQARKFEEAGRVALMSIYVTPEMQSGDNPEIQRLLDIDFG